MPFHEHLEHETVYVSTELLPLFQSIEVLHVRESLPVDQSTDSPHVNELTESYLCLPTHCHGFKLIKLFVNTVCKLKNPRSVFDPKESPSVFELTYSTDCIPVH